MSQIVAVGPEEFTLGFELVGIGRRREEELEELLTQDIGIIILNQDSYDKLAIAVQRKIDKSIKPIVVVLSEQDSKGGHLRDLVVRALGVDVLK